MVLKSPGHIMMPGTDGLEVCTRLRQKSIVPIIVKTENKSSYDQNDGVDGGRVSGRIKHKERRRTHDAENGERGVCDEELEDFPPVSLPEFFEVHNKRVPFIKVITTIIIASFFRLFKRFFKKYRKYEKN